MLPSLELQKYVKLQFDPANVQLMNWDDLRFFLALSRAGSYKGAARDQRVDATTVGRRIAALEGALGVKLFARGPERAVPTAAGRALLPRAERVEAEIFATRRELESADERVEGSLRVTAGDGIVNYVLVPALPALTRRYPELSLELRGDTRALDLSRSEADMALRLFRPRERSLVVRRLAVCTFNLFASQSYLERFGAPRAVEALSQHAFVGFDASLDEAPQVTWLRGLVRKPRYTVRANTTTTQVLACAEGQGIALLPSYVQVHEQRLQRLLPRLVCPSRTLYSVTHTDLRDSRRVRAFQAFAEQALANATAGIPEPGET